MSHHIGMVFKGLARGVENTSGMRVSPIVVHALDTGRGIRLGRIEESTQAAHDMINVHPSHSCPHRQAQQAGRAQFGDRQAAV